MSGLPVSDGSAGVGHAGGPAGAAGGRFSGSWVERAGRGWSGERGAESVEAFGDVGGPAPGLVDAQPDLAGAAGDAGGDVQDPVAEGVDLAAGQGGGVGEADLLGPADQVDRGEDDFEPGVVLAPGTAGQVAQPGGLGFSDAVLDAGVLAVP